MSVRPEPTTNPHSPGRRTTVRYPWGYLTLVCLSALDVMCTWLILALGGAELNPVANAVLSYYGFGMLIVFKFALITLAIVLCEEISRHHPHAARSVLVFGIVLTLAPVTLGSTELAAHLLAN